MRLFPRKCGTRTTPHTIAAHLTSGSIKRSRHRAATTTKLRRYSSHYAVAIFVSRKRISTRIARSNSIFPRRPSRRSFPRARARERRPKSFYNHEPVGIILKSENQSPFLETVKVLGDQLTVGNITPSLYVRKVYKDLSLEQQNEEIRALEEQKQLRKQQQVAMVTSWNK